LDRFPEKAVAAWVNNHCKFASDSDGSDADEGYGRGLNFKELVQLHKLWYRISQLEGKFSARAEKAMMEARADFHVLASKLAGQTNKAFRNWLYAHMLPGWWIRNKKYIQDLWESEGKIWPPDYMKDLANGIIAERCAAAQLEEFPAIDLEDYVRGNEISMGAMEFLASKGIETDAQFDDEAFQSIVNDADLLPEYTQSLRRNPDFLGYFNPRELYGNDWFNASENEQRLFINSLTDDIGQMAYERFIKKWPGYIATAKNVQATVDRLEKAMSTPEDYNGVMTALSLALNTAHNTGLMAEHVGLSDREMDQLSNLDMGAEDAKIKRFMAWIRDNCKFGQSVAKFKVGDRVKHIDPEEEYVSGCPGTITKLRDFWNSSSATIHWDNGYSRNYGTDDIEPDTGPTPARWLYDKNGAKVALDELGNRLYPEPARGTNLI
jgi:hypothetical protein